MRMPQDATWLWKFLYALATLLRPLFCRLRVEGHEHVPSTSGCIIACNHTMGPDYFILGYASPRQIYYMAKVELFQIHPWFSRCLALVGTFPIDRGRNDTAALGAAEALLHRGQVLGMFPEGTRSRTGELRRGKSGVARLAMATQTPVVPAVVINAEALLKQIGRRPEVVVRFGPPLFAVGDPTDKTAVQTQTDAVMRAIAQLLPPAQRGIYGGDSNEVTTKATPPVAEQAP